jgi:hypothetical protein
VAKNDLLQALNEKIRFHRRWQTLTMLGYVIPVTLQALGSLAATFTAASGHAAPAAILSGIATAALLLEKTLKLREKWRLHLRFRTNLEALHLKVVMDLAPPADAAKDLADLLASYVERLPIGSREDTDEPEAVQPSTI